MMLIKELGTEVLSSFRTLSTMVAHTVFIHMLAHPGWTGNSAVFINPPFEGYVTVMAVRTPPSSPYVTATLISLQGPGSSYPACGQKGAKFLEDESKVQPAMPTRRVRET